MSTTKEYNESQSADTELQKLQAQYGDLDVAVEVISAAQVFLLNNEVSWDQFEPGKPGLFILETQHHEI